MGQHTTRIFFSKQWKIQQKAYVNRKKLKNPAEYARKQWKKKRDNKKNKDKTNVKKRNKKRSVVPIITEMWTDRYIDRNMPVLGGRIVAEYDSLSRKVTHLYTMREMVLPEDKLKILNEPMENQWRR